MRTYVYLLTDQFTDGRLDCFLFSLLGGTVCGTYFIAFWLVRYGTVRCMYLYVVQHTTTIIEE